MPETAFTHAGELRRLGNISATSAGSIHDDAPAQALGFRGAFVPGSVVGAKALLAATALLGEQWLQGGWYDLNFISPVYEDEPVRDAGILEGADAIVRVETAAGRLCCGGLAGLGIRWPWHPAPTPALGLPEALPEIAIGFDFGGLAFTVSPEDFAPLCAASGDGAVWYSEPGPWGDPMVPLERLQRIALDLTRTKPMTLTGVRNPGMWAGHALVFHQPIRVGETYMMTEAVADKGRSGRAVFLTYEFRISSLDGSEIAVGRHRVKWLSE